MISEWASSTPSTRRWRSSAPPACPRARCSTRWSCTTTRPSSSAASCRRCTRGEWAVQLRPGRCGSPPPVTAAPLLGENTAEVLGDWLALSDDAIRRTKVWRRGGLDLRSPFHHPRAHHRPGVMGGPSSAMTPQRTRPRHDQPGDFRMEEPTGSEISAKCLKKEGIEQGLHHGRPDAAHGGHLHQGKHPHDRRPPRAGGRVHGAGVQPPAAGPQRLHGGQRAGRDEPDHRRRQRLCRLLPRRALVRRVQPDQPVRPPGVPGDRPDRADARRCNKQTSDRLLNLKRIPQQINRTAEVDQRQAGPVLRRLPRRACGTRKIEENQVALELRRPPERPWAIPRARSMRWCRRSARRSSR